MSELKIFPLIPLNKLSQASYGSDTLPKRSYLMLKALLLTKYRDFIIRKINAGDTPDRQP